MEEEGLMVRPSFRAALRVGIGSILTPLAVTVCQAGTPLPGSFAIAGMGETAQYQPLPTPRSMAPPPAPARPPNPGVRPFGQWQKEGDHFRMKPGFTGPADKAPIWVPGHWTTDADSNRVWVPGGWR
jgi:hypothetical protein